MLGDPRFGRVLRTLRTDAGLTQEDVAERAGLSARAIGDLERGAVRRPHRKTVELLVAALQLDETDSRSLTDAARPPLAGGGASGRPAAGVSRPALRSPGDAAENWTPPRQLPGSTRHFAGRVVELDALDGLLDHIPAAEHAARIAVIAGTAGVGKTTLALHWARRAASDFPDGQLFLNLRGFDPTGSPVTPGQAIRSLLEALGIRPSQMPTSLDAQTGLYRGLVSDKRILLVLDNARDVDQVGPLLPGSPGCVVLITSRSRLASLVTVHGAQLVSLDLPSDEQALELLKRRLPSGQAGRVPTEELDELTALCARLPLALSVAAGHLALNPHVPVASLVARLRDTRVKLATLDGGDAATDVRAVFSWSFHQLDESAARAFRLLSVHPGPDVTLSAAASVAGLPMERARAALDALTRAHLLTESSPGRFGAHDLLRAYAAELTEAHDTEEQRRSATLRMLDHYLHTSMRALSFTCAREHRALPAPAAGVVLDGVANLEQALDWSASERPALLAVVARANAHGFFWHACQTARVVGVQFNRGAHWDDLLATQQIALSAAEALADTEGQARALREIGMAHAGRMEKQQAQAHLRRALALEIDHGLRHGEARSHEALAFFYGQHGDHPLGLDHARRAVDIHGRLGNRPGQASALSSVGWFHSQLGDHRKALACCLEALELVEALSSRDEGNLWDSLGHIYHRLGDHLSAISCYDRAVALFRRFGVRYHLAETLDHLGDVHLAVGDTGAALESWDEALALFEELGRAEAGVLRIKLAAPSRRLPEPAR